MEGSGEHLGAPDSWEVADLDESMNRLMLSSNKNKNPPSVVDASKLPVAATASNVGGGGRVVSEDAVNQVDEFLREALQNPRERLSILRIEQDVEKFIRDPSQQKLEFQQLPTSYLRLAAHRIAQHYHLLSTVVSDNNLLDGSGSRIVVHKTSESRSPPIRLANIPVSSPQGNNHSAIKVAIKQRPRKGSQTGNSANLHSKGNHAKSVEERKEEYNKARARIFSSENVGSDANKKAEDRPIPHANVQPCSLGSTNVDERFMVQGPESLYGSFGDSAAGSSRPVIDKTENEPAGRYRTNKVAIIRDREVDRKDPDYDRSYDRYMQRFDPGFGFSGGPYTIQPIYSPAVNYNTEFPQLGTAHRPQVSIEHQPRHMTQHQPMGGPWAAASSPSGVGYGPPESMLGPLNVNHGAPSTSAIYLHSSHYSCPRPGMQFFNSHEHIHLPFTQPYQHERDANFGSARPR